MTWGKLAGLFSLKALLLACVLTPVPVTTAGLSVANAQFQIIIPGFGYRGYRRSYRRGYRRTRSRGGEAPVTDGRNPAPGSSGKPGVRGSKD